MINLVKFFFVIFSLFFLLLQDVLVITRNTYNRFRVYKKLFKSNKALVFRDKTLKVDNHGRYGSTNKYYKLRKEI